MKFFFYAVAVGATFSSANAAGLKITAAALSGGNSELAVQLSKPATAVAVCSTATDCDALWRVYETSAGTTNKRPVVSASLIVGSPNTIQLTFGAVLNPSSSFEVVYYGGGMAPITASLTAGAPAKTQIIGAAAKADSDLYLTGSYSPRIRSDPQHSYDASLTFPVYDLSAQSAKLGVIGLSGSAKSDKRVDLDPDAFSGGGYWQFFPVVTRRGAFQGLVGQVSALYEFGRKNDNGTLLFPLSVQAPLRIWYGEKGRATLTPLIGFEPGRNLVNALQSKGSGAVARQLAGADLVIQYKPKKPLLYSLSLSTQWRSRWLSRNEIHTFFGKDAAGKVVPEPVFDKHRRDRVESKFQWMIGEFFGVTAGHEYGVVPPVYAFVDHKVTIGLTLGLNFGTASRFQR